MKLNIKATNLELTPALRQYIEQKMDMTEKYLGGREIINCDFQVELTTKHHHKGDIFRAEVNLAMPNELLRIEKSESDLYKAIDKVKDHLVDLIKKYKERRLAQRRRV